MSFPNVSLLTVGSIGFRNEVSSVGETALDDGGLLGAEIWCIGVVGIESIEIIYICQEFHQLIATMG